MAVRGGEPRREAVLTIAGFDSSGGAGIAADIKTISANGGYAAAVVAALTAQNSCGVSAVAAVAPAVVRAQLEAVLGDLQVAAVKTGMLADAATVEVVAAALQRYQPKFFVCDPVVAATTGHKLLTDDAVAVLRHKLLPLATLVTPNSAELARLTGAPVTTLEEAVRAGAHLLAAGAGAVLVKGGHLQGAQAVDALLTRSAPVRYYPSERLEALHTHGTGCILAAAIATYLAAGQALLEAVAAGKAFVTQAIRAGFAVGRGAGPADPCFAWQPAAGGLLRQGRRAAWEAVAGLHVITDETVQQRFSHAELAGFAAAAGARVVQWREKRPWGAGQLAHTARQVRAAVAARGTSTRVVINDRVDIAAAVGADGVHLGRDDLPVATARRLLDGAGAYGWLVGGTANSFAEALQVATTPVDYLGVGPVFGTRSKAQAAPALGLEELRRIVAAVDKPVVAIGNITVERVPEVMSCGVAGVAVIGAVACAADPAAAAAQLVAAVGDGAAVTGATAWSNSQG